MKRNVLKKRIISIFVFFFTIGFLFSLVNYLHPLGVEAKWKKYDEKNKEVGMVETYTKKEDNLSLFIHYPVFNEKNLDGRIKTIIEDTINLQKGKGEKDIIYLDYSTKKIFKQYISVEMIFKNIAYSGKEKDKVKVFFTYDEKNKIFLSVKNIFNDNYLYLLEDKYKITYNYDNIILDGKNIYLKNKEIKTSYKDVKKYLKLDNKNIPKIRNRNNQTPVLGKKRIAFTFDDGPHAYNTQRIMSLFDQYGGKATFFMLGLQIEKYPEVVKDVHKKGYQIGNHSFHHISLANNNYNVINEEIKAVQKLIFSLTKEFPTYLRPPYGEVGQLKQQSDLSIALWTIDTQDWKSKNKEIIKQKIMGEIKDGSIVLMHDIYDTTYDALVEVIPVLKSQGYQFLTLEELYK